MDFAKFSQIMWAILALLLLDISHANEGKFFPLFLLRIYFHVAEVTKFLVILNIFHNPMNK